MSANLTHFDAQGQAHMVDVGAKDASLRIACATGYIQIAPATLAHILPEHNPKGDVLAVARVAAIMASKQTAQLIPLCHPLMLDRVAVDFRIDAAAARIHIDVTAQTHGKTGVEMEALTSVSVGLLTVYDMLKAVDKTMVMAGIGLVSKQGGKSGDFIHPELSITLKP